MKPKTMILLVVAVTCGLGASYMTSRLLADRASAPTEPDTVKVIVAAKNIDMGLPLKNPEELFVQKDFVKGNEPKDGIFKIEDLKGRVLKRSLRQGDAVRQDDLLDHNQGGLAVTLPQGYRAMGLRVNMESIAGGFASLPHSRVDVISTIRRGDDKKSYSEVLLENVLVLAADQQTGRDDQGRAMPANVVTVALKPQDVLKVNIARELGPLSLVLRKFNDNSKGGTEKFTVEHLMTNQIPQVREPGDDTETLPLPRAETPKAAEAPKTQPKVEPEGKLHTIRLFQGDRETHVRYLLDKQDQVIPKDEARNEAAPPRPPQPQVEETPPRPDRPETPPSERKGKLDEF